MFGVDTVVVQVVLVALVALMVLGVAHALRQPPLLAYIITGILVSPFALGIISDYELIQVLGEFGLVLLLFFIGMEIDLGLLLKAWRKVVAGTVLQIVLGVLSVGVVGYLLGWSTARIVLLGFVVSLSSTALVLKHLESRGLIYTKLGSYVCGILFTQDMAVGPMLVLLAFFAGSFTPQALWLQVIGVFVLFGLFYVFWNHKVKIPCVCERFLKIKEHELCFNIAVGLGMAAVANSFGLSVGIGAFLAGMIVARHYARKRILAQLDSVKTILVALFFISVGALIDVSFLIEHIDIVFTLVVLVFVVNTLAYTAIFRVLHIPWRQSVYMAALLAQIGEFSFFIALAGRQLNIISDFGYQITMLVIALTLLFSPAWTSLFRRFEPGAERAKEVAVSPLLVRTPYRWSW